MKTTTLLGIMLGLCLSGTAWADNEGVLQTAGKVLQIGVGARGIAMGEATCAASDDIFSLYWNPAGLEGVRAPQVAYAHNLWLASIQNGFLSYAQPFMDGGIGVGINYINFGQFEKYGVDSYGYPVPLNETFTPYTLVVTTGYAGKWLPFMKAGANLKLISESVATYNNITLASDLGVQFPSLLTEGLDLGLVIQNLGIPLAGYRLPLAAKAGLAYAIPLLINDKNDHFVAAVDAHLPLPLDQPLYVNFGLEYFYWNTVALRVGYRYSDNNTNLGSGMVGLTAGAGIRFAGVTMDYAIAPMGELGMTHRISLAYAFEATKKKTAKKAARKAVVKTFTQPTTTAVGDPVDDQGLMMPTLSKLAMRKPVTVEVETQQDPEKKTRIRKSVFTVAVKSGKDVDRWVLKINDVQGKTVWSTGSEGLPETLVWDGKDRSGNPVSEAIFCTYEFEAIMTDGSAESASGKLLVEADASDPVQEQTPDQVKLAPIAFEENSSDLNSQAIQALKEAAEKIMTKPYVRVMVEGYTDAGSEQEHSFLLSQKRVDSVVRYLTASYKIPLKTIATHARGNKNPVDTNQTPEGREKNRRVELTIIYKQ